VDEQFVHHVREHPGQRGPGLPEPGERLAWVAILARRQHETDLVAQHFQEAGYVALGEMAHHLVIEAVDGVNGGGRYRVGQAWHMERRLGDPHQHRVQEADGGHVRGDVGHRPPGACPGRRVRDRGHQLAESLSRRADGLADGIPLFVGDRSGHAAFSVTWEISQIDVRITSICYARQRISVASR
jgi:hypothetical protein